jgi:hypothetical protein
VEVEGEGDIDVEVEGEVGGRRRRRAFPARAEAARRVGLTRSAVARLPKASNGFVEDRRAANLRAAVAARRTRRNGGP